MSAVEVAEVVRNGFIESVHFGHVVAVDGTGQVLLSTGDVAVPMLPRSTNKLVQAAAMLRLGLALDGELLALAASSHSGEPFHLDGVRTILAGAGLDESALQNTADPTPLQQACSGKHAAMLATCVVNGWRTETYREPEHPLQQAISAVLEELSGDTVTATVVDGCGAPAMAITLVGLARSFSRLSVAAPESAEGRVTAAVRAHPVWVAGTTRSVTRIMQAVPGLVAKDGAEAVYAAALPDGRAVAVKISDGGDRAAMVVLSEALRQIGVPARDLVDFATRPVLGLGRRVGDVRAVPLR